MGIIIAAAHLCCEISEEVRPSCPVRRVSGSRGGEWLPLVPAEAGGYLYSERLCLEECEEQTQKAILETSAPFPSSRPEPTCQRPLGSAPGLVPQQHFRQQQPDSGLTYLTVGRSSPWRLPSGTTSPSERTLLMKSGISLPVGAPFLPPSQGLCVPCTASEHNCVGPSAPGKSHRD